MFGSVPGLNMIGPIQLDKLARASLTLQGVTDREPNPFLDPMVCNALIEKEHALQQAHLSYGGWMEDRGTLWRGSYLDQKGHYLHLGVDINVPVGTPVFVDWPGHILRIDCDTPEEHGWGTRIIIGLEGIRVVLIYAHLAPKVYVGVGDHVHNTLLGSVGHPEDNGGWYPHVHVQAVTTEHYETLLKDDLRTLDGYGAVEDRALLEQVFPDPMPWITLP